MNRNMSVLVTKGNSEDLLETLIFCKNVMIKVKYLCSIFGQILSL